MLGTSRNIDFAEKDGLRFFESVYPISEEYRSGYDWEYKRAFKLFFGYVDMSNRDPYRIHPFFNRVFSTIEMMHATFVAALLGEMPRFPIYTEHDLFRPNVEPLEMLLDYYAEEAGFYLTMSRAFKIELLTGKVLGWPYWDEWEETRIQESPVRANGFTIGRNSSQVKVQRQGLKWQHIAPWMVGIDPYANNVDEARWVYIRRPISLTTLKSHMERFSYKVKFDELKPTSGYSDIGRKIREELGYGFGDNDSDMAMMIMLWCPRTQRYMEILDGETVLRDDIDETEKIYPRCPLVEFNNILSPHSTEFYNIGEVKHVEQVQHLLNDHVGQLMNAQQQQLEGIWMWKPGYGFTDDDLIATGGNRIEIQAPGNEPFDNILKQIQSNPLSSDAYKMVQFIGEMYDQTTGQSDYMMGNMPQRVERAYNVSILKEQSDKRTGVKIANNAVGMARLAMRSLDVVAENLPKNPEYKQELERILGPKAEELLTFDLNRIPGKNYFRYKSTEILAGKQAAFNELASLYQITKEDLPNRPAAVKTMWKKADRTTNDELEEIFTAPAQPAAMPGAPAGMEGQTPANPMVQGNPMPLPEAAA